MVSYLVPSTHPDAVPLQKPLTPKTWNQQKFVWPSWGFPTKKTSRFTSNHRKLRWNLKKGWFPIGICFFLVVFGVRVVTSSPSVWTNYDASGGWTLKTAIGTGGVVTCLQNHSFLLEHGGNCWEYSNISGLENNILQQHVFSLPLKRPKHDVNANLKIFCLSGSHPTIAK